MPTEAVAPEEAKPAEEATPVFDPQFSNPNAHHLTHEQAFAREDAIAALHSYSLFLNLHKRETFEGVVALNIAFRKPQLEFAEGPTSNIFLDFHGEAVKWLKING